MDPGKNRKEMVLRRLKKAAAKIWDYKDSEMEGFDPVIELLFGACAYEFERLSDEIYNSQSRILEKVAHILLPEVKLNPEPSYAIMQARPVNNERFTKPDDQFIFEKDDSSSQNGKEISKKVYFSPTSGFRLIDAEISVLATSNDIFLINDETRLPFAHSKTSQVSAQNKVWIGLKCGPNVKTWKDVSFYFDWPDNSDKNLLLDLLSQSQWFCDSKTIQIKNGYSREVDDNYSRQSIDILTYLDISQKTEKKANLFFEQNYITIDQDLVPEIKKYPSELTSLFELAELQKLKEELFWFEVVFPEVFPAEFLASTICLPNTFPVLNRKLHNPNRPYTLNEDLNIVPLECDDYFFAIHHIISSNGLKYQEVPFSKTNTFLTGTYMIRSKGVTRFDERDALEHVEYLLELLREEYIAFKSIGNTLIEKELKDLLVIMNRLRLNIGKANEKSTVTHFAVIKSEIIEDIWFEFWSTAGAFANNIPAGSTCVHNDFDKKTLHLLTATCGGKNPPDELEKTFIFKNELLNRNRIVTKEDIRIFCQAELGKELKNVIITNSAFMSKNQHTGFQNCLYVKLILNAQKKPEEKERIVNHIRKSLQVRSSCIFNYKVECIDQNT
jgi:hypothetical protein